MKSARLLSSFAAAAFITRSSYFGFSYFPRFTPDPLTNKATVERAKYYSVNSVPSFGIDGVMGGGGGGRTNTKPVYTRIVGDIDKALEVPADATMTLDATLSAHPG